MVQYYRYTLRALTPIRIADDSTSQRGQMNTLTFIPGSTIRGLVISELAKQNVLDTYKQQLFSDEIRFMNAYLTTSEHVLIPSPKGFYESKEIVEGEKEIQNVTLKGEFQDGFKRAALGRYCYIDSSAVNSAEDCIHYYSVKTGSDLRIKIHEQGRADENNSVFRNEYMESEQYFQGYIRLSDKDESLNSKIVQFLKENNTVYLGNGRSAGLGKCSVIIGKRENSIPYYTQDMEVNGECYMMLVSDVVMRNDNGEYDGLNLSEIEKILNVKNLKVFQAATSIRTVRGYNSTWRGALPSIPMYAAGSVFHFTFDGVITADRMQAICDSGIGIRKNEGYGRIMFLPSYEKVRHKIYCEYTYGGSKNVATRKMDNDDKKTLTIVARNYMKHRLNQAINQYVLRSEWNRGGISASQLGTYRSILTKYQYHPESVMDALNVFFDHTKEKEDNQRVQKSRASHDKLRLHVNQIYTTPILTTLFDETDPIRMKDTVMGIPMKDILTSEVQNRYKLKLLLELARFDRKE